MKNSISQQLKGKSILHIYNENKSRNNQGSKYCFKILKDITLQGSKQRPATLLMAGQIHDVAGENNFELANQMTIFEHFEYQ